MSTYPGTPEAAKYKLAWLSARRRATLAAFGYLAGPPADQRIQRVRDLHSAWRIYDECGHFHLPDENGVREVPEVGPVCEEGLLYVICRECCMNGGFQTEECCDNHSHVGGSACYPCPTLRALDGAK